MLMGVITHPADIVGNYCLLRALPIVHYIIPDFIFTDIVLKLLYFNYLMNFVVKQTHCYKVQFI